MIEIVLIIGMIALAMLIAGAFDASYKIIMDWWDGRER